MECRRREGWKCLFGCIAAEWEEKMEELTEYIENFAAGVLFCIAVWLLFSQCSTAFSEIGESLHDLEVLYVF